MDILGTNCDQCRSMVQCCFTSTETVRLIRTERPGRPPRLSQLPNSVVPRSHREPCFAVHIHTSVRGKRQEVNHTHLHSKLSREGSNALLMELAVLEEGVAVVKCSMLNSTNCVQEAPHAWLPWRRQWPVCSTLSILNMTCKNVPAHSSYISEFKEHQQNFQLIGLFCKSDMQICNKKGFPKWYIYSERHNYIWLWI